METRQGPTGIEGTLFELISATASVVGPSYFSAMVEHLADALDVGCAFVSQFVDDGKTVQVIACWPAAADGVQLTCETRRSAGAGTRDGEPISHPAKAPELFPKDPLVEHLGLTSFVAVPVYGAAGRPNGFLGVGDVKRLSAALPAQAIMRLVAARTGAEIERINAEHVIRDQADLLRMFTERAEDIILRLHIKPALKVDYVSPSFERISGYTTDEFYADAGLLNRMIHPDQRVEIAEVLDGGQDGTRRWRFVKKTGEDFWIDGRRVAIRDESGDVIAYETVARDVTAEKVAQLETERAVRSQKFLLDAMPGTILHVSRDGLVLSYKPSSAHDMGLPNRDPVGRPMSSLLPLDVVPLAIERIALAIDSQRTYGLRYRKTISEEERLFDVRIAPAMDQAVLLISDITAADLMTKEESRLATRDELETKAEQRVRQSNPYSLSFREFTVLELVAAGSGDKQIATELGISVYTVHKHVSNILGKMGVATRTEASVRAVQEHLLGA